MSLYIGLNPRRERTGVICPEDEVRIYSICLTDGSYSLPRLLTRNLLLYYFCLFISSLSKIDFVSLHFKGRKWGKGTTFFLISKFFHGKFQIHSFFLQGKGDLYLNYIIATIATLFLFMYLRTKLKTMIDHQTVERILDAAQIVDVVSEFVNLRKAGVNYKGLCPFHDDKDPSLVVSPAKGLYKCFSCGHGGNAVRFIMEHEQLSYPDALRWLARKYHIEIREKELTNEEKQLQDERESMFVVNEWACKYFQDILQNDVDGRAIGMAYFRSRGFRDDIIKKFQLGYSPSDKYALSKEAKRKGFKDKYLIATGLCYQKEDGTLHDRFYGRAIFPIQTLSGKVVAFGGRVLDAATKGIDRKYVNSPESDIYNKSRELYGLFQAKQAIVREERCFLVEGYTDVISMHQAGIENVVSSSGTSLTTGQIRLLHRFTNNITLLYDGDAAGIKASLRGTNMLLEEGMNIKILFLPDGEDPDSFARKHTAKEFQDYIKANQVDFIHFKTEILLDETGNDPLKKASLIRDIVESIAVIPDEIIRSVYIKESAKQLNTEERVILNEVNKTRKQNKEKKQTSIQSDIQQNGNPSLPTSPVEEHEEISSTSLEQPNPFYKTETLIMQEIIRYGELQIADADETDKNGNPQPISVLEYILMDLQQDKLKFHTQLYNEIAEDLLEHLHQSENFSAQNYLLAHPDGRFSKLAAELSTDKYLISKIYEKEETQQQEENISERIPHLLIDLKLAVIEKQLKDTKNKLLDPTLKEQPEQLKKILKEIQNLSGAKKTIAQRAGDRSVLASKRNYNSTR